MKIVFISNILTPHQLPLAINFVNTPNVDFSFIEAVDIEQSTLPIGWLQNGNFDFVVSYNKFINNLDYYMNEIYESDVVIIGSAPEYLIKKRLKANKLTLKYSERVYKKKCPWYQLPLRAVKYFFKYNVHKNLYLLCASAYTSSDYAKTATFLGRTFKWGYFPETKKYDINTLISKKQKNSILWVGRMLDWKHPETAIEIAKRLKEDGFKFALNVIGSGDMYNELEHLIEKYNLKENVELLGAMPPEKVREYMELSEIYLMTSDRNEGWGAVVNEAMNSGCAIIGNQEAGSVPFLIENGKNGYSYKNKDIDDLYNKIKILLDNPEKKKEFGINAYKTIINHWNAENAAQRFVELSSNLLNNKNTDVFSDGICSKAFPYL